MSRASVTPMMQLGHLFAGQVVMYISLVLVVVVSESRMVPRAVYYLAGRSFLRVSDAKGVFCFLFSSSTVFIGFMLEAMRSVAKICKKDRMKYRVMKAQRGFTYMTLILFIDFLGAYIFRSLNDRTTSLLVLGLSSHVCCSLSAFFGMDMLNTFFYITFAMSNVCVLLLTYVSGFDRVFSSVGGHLERFRLSWA